MRASTSNVQVHELSFIHDELSAWFALALFSLLLVVDGDCCAGVSLRGSSFVLAFSA